MHSTTKSLWRNRDYLILDLPTYPRQQLSTRMYAMLLDTLI